MGTDPYFWIGDPDHDPLFMLLCDLFPDIDPRFVTRSFPDPDHDIMYIGNYPIQLIRFYFIIRNNIYVGIIA